ncbi:MAG: diguanylate cyclase domain-containing protein [Actinomycetota bacterium]
MSLTEDTIMTHESPSSKPRVLLIDDDPGMRRVADLHLSDVFDVRLASSGTEGLALALRESPDVIVLDNVLPDMKGIEVVASLSRDPRTSDVPVVFLSAPSATEEKIEGLEHGAVDYLTKPVEPRELTARLAAFARIRARQEELRLEVASDPLTELPDRKIFESRLAQEAARSSRSGIPVSTMIVDVDRFDQFNKMHGARAGDELLRQMASTLRATLRASDSVYRYGEDEFAALLPDTELATAYLAAERCRAEIGNITFGGLPTSVSIGIAEASSGHSAQDLVGRAEIALGHAKESGGGCSWRADDPRRHGLNPVALSEELTSREWDLLTHISHRRTEPEIARLMGISRGTVRSHKARIRRKLHISPEVRLADFVRMNFKDLMYRLPVTPQRGSR